MMDDLTLCKLCETTTARYTCPRCNARYCSVDCYRSEAHIQCSELFYRNCFLDGLQELEAGTEERQKMLEMLQRLEEEDVLPEDLEEDLSDRIADIDLNRHPEKIWKRLTSNEKKEFADIVKSNKISQLVAVWTPWWCKDVPALLETSDGDTFNEIPSTWKGVKGLELLLGSIQPSDTICFDILNTLYGYAYISRLYNGDCSDLAIDSASGLISIAGSLENSKFCDVSSALTHCLARLATGEKGESCFVSKEFSVAVIEDVSRIVKGPNVFRPHSYVNAALSESCVVFRNARKRLDWNAKQSGHDRGAGDQTFCSKKSYFQAQKKLEFYLSWTVRCGDVLTDLVPHIEMEFCALSTELAQHRNDCSKVEGYLNKQKILKNRNLIEEI